jgi:hypothetical protein
MSGSEAGADPWQDLSTENPPPEEAWRALPVRPSQRRAWKAHWDQSRENWQHLAQECEGEWHDFGQQPGTHLRLVRTGIMGRSELRTAEQQTIARRRDWPGTAISAGGRTFTWKEVTGSSWPGIAEMVRHAHQNGGAGDFPDPGTPDNDKSQAAVSSRKHNRFERSRLHLGALRDETGMPILYTSGRHYNHIAGARITFPDERWLRFPVRGTGYANAIMTAMDQAGNKVARYRLTGKLSPFSALAVEITVHPKQPLTDELVLAIAMSAGWLDLYCSEPAGGG